MDAYQSFAPVLASDFDCKPEELRQGFKEIKNSLTAKGSVPDTLKQISDKETDRIMELILEFHRLIQSHLRCERK
jgi:hypothetical protein